MSKQPPPPNAVDHFLSAFSGAFESPGVTTIILLVVSTLATVAIVYGIVVCLHGAGKAFSSHAKGKKTERQVRGASETSSSPQAMIPVVADSRAEFATIERFISNVAKEKPTRFSPDQLSTFTKRFSKPLGSGGFGTVYKGEFPNGVPIAVKVLGSSNKRVEQQQFMAEVSTIGRTNHINLVRLYGFCFSFSPAMTALVYEYMEKGSLDKFLFGDDSTIEWAKLYNIAVGTGKGIAYLHEECQQRVIHYDIKPANVLLDGNWNPKVADFGLAKLCNRDSTPTLLTGARGTPGYAAPELWTPCPVTHKCDVYSFGMLLFEILWKRRNFVGNLNESRQWLPKWTWEMYKNNELPSATDHRNKENAGRVAAAALWCIQRSPEARPLMSTVVKMLEGDVEIPPPPNPFEDPLSPGSASSGGSDRDFNTSDSGTDALLRHWHAR